MGRKHRCACVRVRVVPEARSVNVVLGLGVLFQP